MPQDQRTRRFARTRCLLLLGLAGGCAAPASGSDYVVVQGAVEHGGCMEFGEGATLLDVVLAAVPQRGRADLSRVELSRARTEVSLTVDLESMLVTGDRTWDVPVQPADTVIVPELEGDS
jgi:protein involved in polysaccharide export with SLBB domain